MNPKKLINKPISYGGKIGIVTDVFTNGKEEFYVVFESAESIVRSKFGFNKSEFIPFSGSLVKELSFAEVLLDIEKKKEYAKTELAERIRSGIEAVGNAEQTVAYINDMDAVIVVYKDDTTLVIRDVYGTVSVVKHEKMYINRPADQCKEIAEKRNGFAAELAVQNLDKFAEFVKSNIHDE